MNFGSILNSITSQCVSLMLEGSDYEAKTLAKNFFRFVNLKKPLKAQFYAYTTLREATIKDPVHADLLVKETLNLFTDLTIKDLKNYNALLESRFMVRPTKSTSIDKAITKVIQSTLNSTGYNAIAKNKSYVSLLEHVQSEQKSDESNLESSPLFENSTLKYLKPNSVVRLAIKKFNKDYISEFDIKEKAMFITLSSNNSKNLSKLKTDLISEVTSLTTKVTDEDLKQKTLEAIYKIKGSDNIQHGIIDLFYMNKELHNVG